jgi:hypothetical protein
MPIAKKKATGFLHSVSNILDALANFARVFARLQGQLQAVAACFAALFAAPFAADPFRDFLFLRRAARGTL